jgi:SAM-dependent methyltransferase
VAADPDLSPLDVIAPFYDLDLEGYEDDVAMYLALGEEAQGAVLELGCGTGRVARALAQAGHAVTGVDASPAMLAVAQRHGGAVEWLEGDMRTLNLGRRFALVLAPLGGLQHLVSVDDVVATFEVIARHLEPSGMAVIDVEAPRAEDFEAGPQPVLEHWTRAWRGGRVTKWVAVSGAPALGLREVTWHFDEQPPEGGLRRHSARFTMRTFTLGELELAARLAGLAAVEVHGDYDGSPYDDGASRLVVTFEHAEGGE